MAKCIVFEKIIELISHLRVLYSIILKSENLIEQEECTFPSMRRSITKHMAAVPLTVPFRQNMDTMHKNTPEKL